MREQVIFPVLCAVAIVLAACGGSTPDPDAGQYGTWLWNGAAWSLLETSTETVPRYGGLPSTESLMYWRPAGGLIDLDRTKWDGRKWVTNDAFPAWPLSRPEDWIGLPVNKGAVVVDDANDQLLILDSLTQTIWGWSDGAWKSLVSVDQWPGARYVRGAAYDPNGKDVLILFCCKPGELGEETWMWDGRALTRMPQLLDGEGGPLIRVASGMLGMASDGNKHILAFGVSTFSWDGQNWSFVGSAPSLLQYVHPTYDARSGQLIAISSDGDKFETWLWEERTWKPIPIRPSPPGKAAISNLVYDADVGGLVVTALTPDRGGILP